MSSNGPRAMGATREPIGAATPKPSGGDRPVRLSLALSPKIAAALKSYAERHEISITEAVRRAVSVLDFVQEVQDSDDEKLAVARGDAIREIEFRW